MKHDIRMEQDNGKNVPEFIPGRATTLGISIDYVQQICKKKNCHDALCKDNGYCNRECHYFHE